MDPLATIGVDAIDREVSDQARERAQRIVAAEAELVGLRAQVEFLTEQMEVATWARDAAEQALMRVTDIEDRRVFVPGDDEPAADDVQVVVSLYDGEVFVRSDTSWNDHPWRNLWGVVRGGAVSYDWRGLDDFAPLVDVTGYGSKMLRDSVNEEQTRRTQIRSICWDFERAALAPHLRQEFEIDVDRERAGSIEEFRAIHTNATRLIYKLAARVRSAQPFSETTDETLARQGAELEQARSVAVRLEGELAAVRQAVEAIHYPQPVGGADPEDPTIICQACRSDYPCETRSFIDALDPRRELEVDEFAGQPEPF